MTVYLIKVILCSAVFLLTYKILLKNERMHRFNRAYLLSALLLPFLIPFLTFTFHTRLLPAVENVLSDATVLVDNGTLLQPEPASGTNYYFFTAVIIYVIITALLVARFIRNFSSIFRITRNSTIIPYKQSKMVLIDEDITPHSFLNYIFINKERYSNSGIEDEILAHEYAHVQQKHSYDIVFIELLQAIAWFNPFIFLYKKPLRLTHEYLADEAVISVCKNTAAYQYLLIEKASKPPAAALACQFNYSVTKKRLLMMTKTTSLRKVLCRQFAVIPVAALAVLIFSTDSFAQDTLAAPQILLKEAPSTQEGVSQELMDEYAQIVNKAKNEKGRNAFNRFSDADKARLETIFLSMSKEQQAKQIVIFMPAPPPLPVAVPTKEQLNAWKNPKMYGVWINEKKVSNAELSKYTNTDFKQVFVSKLYGAAKKNVKYFYQVNLMTKEYYDAYYEQETGSKKRYYMGIRMGAAAIVEKAKTQP
jgi:bla regulator protein blaR1